MSNEDKLCQDKKFLNALAWRVGWRIVVRVFWVVMGTLIVNALLWVLILSIFGCAHTETVTPRVVESQGASYDAGERNSGIIGFVNCGEARCVLVTPHFRDRYNGLIATYGQRFVPPIGKDYGVTDTGTNLFLLTKEAMEKSGLMHTWRASGQ